MVSSVRSSCGPEYRRESTDTVAPGATVPIDCTVPIAYRLVAIFLVKMSRGVRSAGMKAETKKCCEIATQPLSAFSA